MTGKVDDLTKDCTTRWSAEKDKDREEEVEEKEEARDGKLAADPLRKSEGWSEVGVSEESEYQEEQEAVEKGEGEQGDGWAVGKPSVVSARRPKD